MDGLEQMIVSDSAAQMLPKEFDQIEPGRVGWQREENKLPGNLFEKLAGLVTMMDDKVVDDQNDSLSVVLGRSRDRVHKLLDEGTEAHAVLVLFDAMDGLTGDRIDRAKAIALLIGARGSHLAL